jgi:type III restriction enzyme
VWESTLSVRTARGYLIALPKLRRLARFAEVYGQNFHRIESISRIGGELRVLDLTLPEVRKIVLKPIDADSAYRESSAAH